MTLKFALKTNSAIKEHHVNFDISKSAQIFQIAVFKMKKEFLYFLKNAHTTTLPILLSEPLTFPIPTTIPTYPAYLAPSSLLTLSPPPEWTT